MSSRSSEWNARSMAAIFRWKNCTQAMATFWCLPDLTIGVSRSRAARRASRQCAQVLSPLRCHAPRSDEVKLQRQGLLDHPLSRMIATEVKTLPPPRADRIRLPTRSSLLRFHRPAMAAGSPHRLSRRFRGHPPSSDLWRPKARHRQ
jgi:hypothetical protein